MSLLELNGVGCQCQSGFELKNISFEINEKGVYGFLGKSGSGKTVLAQVLAGARQTDSGSVKYKDVELYETQKQTAQLKRKIGYVPQKCFFDMDDTAFEALEAFGKLKRIDPDKRFRQIKEAFELTGLAGKYDVLVSDLSLSERKRLCIAASLMGNPDVIIMDEPLQYMDKNQASAIRSVIELLRARKVLVVLSTRAADLQEMSDNIAFLNEGEIVLWENTEKLVATLSSKGLGNIANAYEALTTA